MKKSFKIGIIGLGVVGGQIYNWFKKKKFPVLGYDKFKNIGRLEDLKESDIIFLCLPTPFKQGRGADLSALRENLNFFKTLKGKIFVIKSTVPPKTTEKFQKTFKNHYFLVNPEFLREADPLKTFLYPDLQIVGYTKKSKKYAPLILKLLPEGKYNVTIPATETEVIKYTVNAFLATKVIFANQIYDLCSQIGADYETVREVIEHETRIGRSHLEIFHQGYRGFGGKCLPKDLKNLIHFCKRLNIQPELFLTVDKINCKLLKSQRLLKKLYRDWLNNKS